MKLQGAKAKDHNEQIFDVQSADKELLHLFELV